jgi:uncharacterized protein (TIGR03435 family)
MPRMPALALRLCLLLAAALSLAATTFEVASIKPAIPDAFGSSGEDGKNGLLKVYNVNLRRCIRYAYGVPDITARADQPVAEPQLLTMLQPLLADRFKLTLHRETRQVAGYILTAAKGGIKAAVSAPDGRLGANGGRGRIDTVGTGVSELIIRLSDLVQQPVVDKTQDTRKFDFHVRWSPDTAPGGAEPVASEGPSLSTALEEQLGLRLVSQQVLAEVLVIDHAELPSAN